MSNTKPKCQTCGRKIPTSGSRLSSIGFRRKVNGITTLDDLINSKEYLAQFVKSRFQLKEYVDKFLARLEEMIASIQKIQVTISLILKLGYLNIMMILTQNAKAFC